ncbi:sugar phosphate isomerase/epimerase family protein [Rhizobium rhizogenes]|uniref:Sugar phosphate isomerase protein n=1 Tax=Rhizobium rhizogenes (strain K84 / ATCC BAA-868) TaxID=311403 RepID=B9JNZ1_RHIR8|nr:TIM barrel protein [Rhizobium rhizogenes]ACM29271.1 Sugar phosphate isomerase protein [Rhizobium rhizogenes K84]QCL10424.1 xylose isomerase-like TIM barrel family protein [Rhizobium rhizogenes]QCO89392.1 xylose isomerase-like TIM barrel family protein [Rhizobium rhizogenes]TRB17063.1 sugar phosphate isomerase/epimerase [Rhizobium rhizogenes]
MSNHNAPLAPVLGAALLIDDFEELHRWIFDADRDLELEDFANGKTLDGDWQSLVERYKKLLVSHGGRLGIHGPFWDNNILAVSDPQIRPIVQRRFVQGVDVCEALGATHMVVHSPFTMTDGNNMHASKAWRDYLMTLGRENLMPAVKRAEEVGCVLMIENVEDTNPFDRVAFAQSFESQAVRVSVDTGHAHLAHRMAGAPPVDCFIGSAGRLLQHIHIQDVDGYADRHWAPGDGEIHWRSVFEAISLQSSHPRLILEIKDKRDLIRGANYLRDLGLAS